MAWGQADRRRARRDGAVNVLENVCAHRGASFCYEEYGNAKVFQCPYHQWSYDLSGKLIGVPFRNGIGGEGGLSDDFDMSAHGLTALHVTRRNGVVYASYDATMEPLEDYFNDNLYYMDRSSTGANFACSDTGASASTATGS